MKPRVFIGSSVEGLQVASAIQAGIEHISDPVVWTQGVFKLTRGFLESLLKELASFDFAILVCTPDDVVRIKRTQYKAARDNVILELGLFLGGLGPDRTFFVVPRGIKGFRLPTDLLGITAAEYNADRDDGNIQAAVGPVCFTITEHVRRLGKVDHKLPVDRALIDTPTKEPLSKGLNIDINHAHVNLHDRELNKTESQRRPGKFLDVDLSLHIIASDASQLIIPHRFCGITVEIPKFLGETTVPLNRWRVFGEQKHPTVRYTNSEAVITGSGELFLDGSHVDIPDELAKKLCGITTPAMIHASIQPVGFSKPIQKTFEIPFETNKREGMDTLIAKWHLHHY